MTAMNTDLLVSAHAASRMQQRGIPPLILEWLRQYGSSEPAAGSADLLYFDKRAKRKLSQDVGGAIVDALMPLLDAFAVMSVDGRVITTGWRTQRVRRNGFRAQHVHASGKGACS